MGQEEGNNTLHTVFQGMLPEFAAWMMFPAAGHLRVGVSAGQMQDGAGETQLVLPHDQALGHAWSFFVSSPLGQQQHLPDCLTYGCSYFIFVQIIP